MTGVAAQVVVLKSCSLAGGGGLEAVPATALAGCSALRSVTLNNCDLVRPPAFLAAAHALRSLSLAGAPPPLLGRGVWAAATRPSQPISQPLHATWRTRMRAAHAPAAASHSLRPEAVLAAPWPQLAWSGCTAATLASFGILRGTARSAVLRDDYM